jgi:biopolymer transport protein TolR
MLQTRACLAERNSEERNIMAFSMAGGGARGPQINVTPLIDVLLTLIVMFMLVVAMDKEYQEKAQIPQPDQKSDASARQPETTIVIQVLWTSKDGAPTVTINHEDVRWQDLKRGWRRFI